MKTILSLLLALLILAPATARACYNSNDVEAEQGLRIHTELMVIGLTCMKMPEGPALYSKYREFTSRNADLISQYESDLIQHYGRGGEKKLHTLRTNMANEISRRAVRQGTVSFCNTYGSHIDEALAMDRARLRRWAQHVFPGQPVSEQMCHI